MSHAERIHGGLDTRALVELGVAPHEVLDFSVNLNPYGPPDSIVRAVREANLSAYPDVRCMAAREAWANALGTVAERIAVGHGVTDLMWAIVRAFVVPTSRVVIAEPTFSELRVAAEAQGARVERVFTELPHFALDLMRVLERAKGAELVYLCSPNNPTGEALELARVCEFARLLGDTLVVLDQSFLSLSDRADELRAPLPENVIALRSLTKDFALAGLRIGYLVAHPDLVARVERQRPTWAVSAPALSAIACAAHEEAFVRASWQRMRDDRERLRAGLMALGVPVISGAAGYVLARVGDARPVTRALLQQRIQVRDCTSFGLPAYVRLAARPAHEGEALLRAFATLHA